MNSIYDIVQAPIVAEYYEKKVQGEQPYLGEVLFPRQQKLGLDLKWIKGAKGLPVVLKSSAFDVKAQVRDRVGFAEVQTEMPFFKESYLVKEHDRQELNKLIGNPKNQPYIDMITKNIFDDVTDLVNGSDAQFERMRMSLISTGKILIASTDETGAKQDMTYDFGLKAEQKKTSDWSLASADILGDIAKWVERGNETGITLNRAVCNSTVISYMMKNENIINAMKGNLPYVNITKAKVISFVEQECQITIQVYDKMYKSEAGVSEKFFKDGIFTLIPTGTLGTSWLGTTPEQSDLMSGQTEAQVQIVKNGVAITTSKKIDPVNVNTKVSMIALPSFEMADSIVIATVKP